MGSRLPSHDHPGPGRPGAAQEESVRRASKREIPASPRVGKSASCAREEGRRLKDGRIAFRRATHQEIANRIGTTRETVTRMLKDLERQGLIHVEGKEIVVEPNFEKVFD